MDAKAATAGVGRDHVDGHAAAVAERVSTRRAGLQPFCQVEPVKPHLRLRSYFQLARQLYRQSEVYCDEQSWDKAYVMMAKFIKICSKVITAHPEYDLPSNEHEREWIHTQAREALSLFDAILDGMEAEERDLYQYERQMEDMVASVSQKPSAKADRPQSVATASALQSATTSLEGRLQALKLAPSSPPSPPPSTPSLDPPPAPPSRSVPLARSYPASKAYRITPQTKTVNYPSIGKASWIPSKALGRQSSRHSISPFSRRLSIEALESFSSASTRTLQIPSHVIAQFTNIAAPNTNMPPNGIETCGILAGVLDNGALRITTLIIPKQEGSADMCTMKNEEELFTYCDTNNLLTLGWIHTHPTQTCFLSSIDIHTQCGFQSMLPEAVAIVVAPNDRTKNVGVFRLTEPTGLEIIQNCRLTGFHSHPSDVSIYSDAFSCQWMAEMSADVVDMRYYV